MTLNANVHSILHISLPLSEKQTLILPTKTATTLCTAIKTATTLCTTGPIHESIPLSQMPGSGVLELPTRTVSLEGGATIVKGQHFNAIK